MSLRISLQDPPEFYTNLDVVKGVVLIALSRREGIRSIVVKLEGESKSALTLPDELRRDARPAGVLQEKHKVLYKFAQLFSSGIPTELPPGQHRFPFEFRIPFNNACSNGEAMARLGAAGWLGGVRVMDSTRQLMYPHVTKTLPPSLTGFPEAEIRYYVKVTVQRPGLFTENWRHQVGFKFLPIENPRPRTNQEAYQEAYARRPYSFRPPVPIPSPSAHEQPPSFEMSARLPHPPILTCNQPIPLRLIAKKLARVNADVYLIALQIDLIGYTRVRCYDLSERKMTRWVVVSRIGLSIPLGAPDAPVGGETVIPDTVWDLALPNTVMPSFVTCNISRQYQLEIKLGLAWGGTPARGDVRRGARAPAQQVHLPLTFSHVEVYSGLAPPAQLVEAAGGDQPRPAAMSQSATSSGPPTLPPRLPGTVTATATTPHDPLYPPQLRPGQVAYDDAPPSYDEAMAEAMPGLAFPPTARPAWSGVTDENGPRTIPHT